MFQGTKVPGNERSRERKFQGTKVPPMELSFLGTKVLWYESSSYPLHMPIKEVARYSPYQNNVYVKCVSALAIQAEILM